MKRLIETSTGRVAVEIGSARLSGLTVTVEPFDHEGWEREGKSWAEKYGHHERGETLEHFLCTALHVPAAEADALAEAIRGPWMTEWKRRGGPEEERKIARFAFIAVTGLAAIALLALTAIGLLIWLFVR